jgi:hypothetical protein
MEDEGGDNLMPSFTRDIRSLFRTEDVEAMSYAFNLSQCDEVKANAEAIYSRLADGSMPCDGAWPNDRLALFRQWIDEGCAP